MNASIPTFLASFANTLEEYDLMKLDDTKGEKENLLELIFGYLHILRYRGRVTRLVSSCMQLRLHIRQIYLLGRRENRLLDTGFENFSLPLEPISGY